MRLSDARPRFRQGGDQAEHVGEGGVTLLHVGLEEAALHVVVEQGQALTDFAAALVIGLAAGILAFGRTPAPDTTDASVALTEVSHESATLLGAPDAARVTLWDSSGAARGSIVVAKSAGRMVAVAVDLPDPGVGREYACWVEVGGVRTRLGTMWLTGTVAWWNGPAALPDSLGPGARFGVSLVTVGSGGAGDPVLTGRL